MGTDPVLAFHRVAPRLYELSGLRTASIRDQIMRAQLLAERLQMSGELPKGSHLLVVGGGACGATLALAAIKLGVNVTMLERERTPFVRQTCARARWLDPSEYDWPHEHWDKPTMRWKNKGRGPKPYALHYSAGPAPVLAARWTRTWARFADKPKQAAHMGALAFLPEVDVRCLSMRQDDDKNCFHLDGLKENRSHGKPFNVVVSCIGSVAERVSVDVELPKGGKGIEDTEPAQMHGPLFWHDDDLGRSDLGITPPAEGKIKVLISGGGDGAQQDLQRVLTGKCAKALMRALNVKVSKPTLAHLLAQDDLARRSHTWSAPGQLPVDDFKTWEAAYALAASEVFNQWGQQKRKALVAKHFKPGVEVTWLMSEPVMTYGFGLNKLLSLLILKLHAEQTGRPLESPDLCRSIMVRSRKIKHVEPLDHECPDHKGHCFDKGHQVKTVSTHASADAHTGGDIGTFHVLVIRHGVEQKPLFTTPPVPEQIIPLYRPA